MFAAHPRLWPSGLLASTIFLLTGGASEGRAEPQDVAEPGPSLLYASPQELLGTPEYLHLVVEQVSEVWGDALRGFEGRLSYTGLLTVGAELDLEAAGWIRGASVGAFALFIQGQDISSERIGDAGVVSNIAGEQSVRLFTAWYMHRWLDDRIRAKLGILAIDDDFLLLESSLLFVNSGFGLAQTIALNIPAPVYPLGALGAMVRVRPAPEFALQFGIYDGNAGDESTNRHVGGLDLSGDQGATLLLEVDWQPSSAEVRAALGGMLHLGQLPSQAASGEERGLAALYLMAEQQLLAVGAGALWGFTHVSVAVPSQLTVAAAHVDLGLTVGGGLWSRPDDRLGLAVAFTRFGRLHVEEERRMGRPGTADEWVFELTYELLLLPWISVQPTGQFITQTHFSARSALALGLRLTVSL